MKLKRILLVLVLLAAALAVALVLLVDTLAERGIEAGGSYALGVPTELGSAKIGLLSGEFSLHELEVSNPEGFQGEHILTLGEAALAVALPSLLEEEIHAPRLELSGIHMLLEKKHGDWNYEAILDHLQKVVEEEGGGESGGEKEASPVSGKKYLFDEIILRDVTTSVDALGEGEISTASITIPEARVDDVGLEPMTLPELYLAIFETLFRVSIELGAEHLPAQLTQQLETRLQLLTGDLVDKAVEELSEELGEEAGQLLEGVLNQAKGGVDQGIRDLFGKKKKE